MKIHNVKDVALQFKHVN